MVPNLKLKLDPRDWTGNIQKRGHSIRLDRCVTTGKIYVQLGCWCATGTKQQVTVNSVIALDAS